MTDVVSDESIGYLYRISCEREEGRERLTITHLHTNLNISFYV